MTLDAINTQLLSAIRQIIEQARYRVQQTVNSEMVLAYWHIGRVIVEGEQQGQQRAAYGKQQLQHLSEQLTREYGKGFDISNLRNMRRFYQSFPIRDTLRLELSWSHYRVLLRLENPRARNWYMQETLEQNWSVRALERQIGVLYYERLLASQDRVAVEQEAKANTTELRARPEDYLRDPYVLDFLNLPSQTFLESELEQGLIDNLQQFLLELGKGFAFIARQQRISTDDQDFYIDLVFYNLRTGFIYPCDKQSLSFLTR
jgi:predicted nuclease of restriction endonuclease-like (RecB) superfamily